MRNTVEASTFGHWDIAKIQLHDGLKLFEVSALDF